MAEVDLTTITGLAEAISEIHVQLGQQQNASTELARLQAYSQPDQPIPAKSSTVTNISSGGGAVFISPTVIFSGTTTTNSGWTPCSLATVVPSGTKFLILEWALFLAGGVSTPVSLYSRINSVDPNQRLLGFVKVATASSGFGSQVGIMPCDPQNSSIDFLATSFAGVGLVYSVDVCGYYL